jgi:hypothetical protein
MKLFSCFDISDFEVRIPTSRRTSMIYKVSRSRNPELKVAEALYSALTSIEVKKVGHCDFVKFYYEARSYNIDI